MRTDVRHLRKAFGQGWSRNTSYPKTRTLWNTKNPSFGQCAVTSLVVNDLFGGKIVYNKEYHHYWNILDDGSEIDLTREQFGKNVVINEFTEASRNYMIYSDAAERAKTRERYELLKNKVEKLLLVETVK
jgi:hypothetical protein